MQNTVVADGANYLAGFFAGFFFVGLCGCGGVRNTFNASSSRFFSSEVFAMQKLPSITELPIQMNNEIGKIIVGFAFFEYTLTRIAYELLGIDPKQGRVAVRASRGHELVEMVRDLCELAKLKIKFKFAPLITTARATNVRRDLIAHGVWLRDEPTGNIFLLRTRGHWKPEKHKSGNVKRAISPQGEQHTAEDLMEIRTEIDALVKDCIELKRQVQTGLASLRKKQLPQSPQKSRSHSPTQTMRKHPQKS